MNSAAETGRWPNTRNIGLFFIGKLFSVLGAGMFTFASGLYILGLTGSGGSLAITMLCGLLPRILLAPFVGVLADRLDKRKLLIGSDAASVAVMVFAFLASQAYDGLSPLYVSLALLAVCSTFYGVTASSSLLQLVDRERLQQAGSLNQIAISAGNIAAPVLGSLLYALLSLESFMLLNAAGFLVSTVMTCLLRFKPSLIHGEAQAGAAPVKPTLKETGRLFQESLGEGMSYVRSRPLIAELLKLTFWINFFFSALGVVMPFIMIQSLLFSETQYGTVQAMLSAGMLAMSLLLTARKAFADPLKPLFIGLSATGVLFLLVAFPLWLGMPQTAAYWFYMMLMLLFGIAVITINIPLSVHLQSTVDENVRGRVFGLLDTMSGAIAPLGTLLYGVLLDYIPSAYIPAVSGIALLVISAVGYNRMRAAAALPQALQAGTAAAAD